MQYSPDKPIYLQIADYLCNLILLQHWKADERVPSARNLSVQMGVNPNTVVRTFELLESQAIIYNKRGIGYFVSIEAISIITKQYRQKFFNETLPAVFDKMKLLNISIVEVVKVFK